MGIFNPKNRFNKMFEGYEQRTEYDRYGNESRKYVYVSNYYEPDMTETQFRLRKLINVLLLIVAIAGNIVVGIIKDIPMNRAKYFGIAQCLSILALIAAAVFIVAHLMTPYKMEIHQYNTAHEKMRVVTLISWLVMAAVAVCSIVSIFVYISTFNITYIFWALAYVIAALSIFFVWFLEKNTDYYILPPEHF